MKRVVARVVAVLAIAGATVMATAAPSFADSLTIRKIDTTKFPHVELLALANGGVPNLADFHLRENGHIVSQLDVLPLSKTNVSVGIVLAIDVSGSMNQNGKIEQARAAAAQFVAQKLPTAQALPAEVAVTASSRLSVPGAGLATWDHFVPFQRSTSVFSTGAPGGNSTVPSSKPPSS